MGWKLQHADRSGRDYYQAVGPNRKTAGLGYLTEREIAWATRNLAYYEREKPNLFQILDTKGIKALLVTNPDALDDVVDFAIKQQIERQMAAADYSTMTFGHYVRHVHIPMRRKDVSSKTAHIEESWVWPIILGSLGDVLISDLNQKRWTAFITQQTTISAGSRRHLQTTYRSALTRMEEHGAIDAMHTFRRLKSDRSGPRQLGESLNADEVRRLLDAASGPTHRALFAFAFGQGCRPAEAPRLQWEDVDWARDRVRIRGSKTGLSDATVPMTAATRAELHPYWVSLGSPQIGHAFTVNGGKPFVSWKHSLRRAVKTAGLLYDENGKQRQISQYSARYTFATLAAEAGVANAAARKMMRHASTSRLLENVYQRMQIGQVADAMEAFPSFGPTPALPQAAQASAVPAPAAAPASKAIRPSKRTLTIAKPKVAPVSAQPTPLIAVAEGYYDDFIV